MKQEKTERMRVELNKAASRPTRVKARLFLLFVLNMFIFSTNLNAQQPAKVTRHIFSSLPVVTIDNLKTNCIEHSREALFLIQKTFGLEIANSAYLCGKLKLGRRSAFLDVDVTSKCGLHRTKDKFIDPCSQRSYNYSGKCLALGCTHRLLGLYVAKTENHYIFIPKGTELVEFQDEAFFSGLIPEEQLLAALQVRAYSTVSKIINSTKLEVMHKDDLGVSLLESYIAYSNWGKLDEFLQLVEGIDKSLLGNKQFLATAMKFNKYQIAKILIDNGAQTINQCAKTSEYEITKLEVLGCKMK